MPESVYVVAGSRRWSRRVFDEVISGFPGTWHFIDSPEDLTPERVRPLGPRYIFFLHWSWKVSDHLIDACECVGFHMTDLPYGRGGSPLQNLVLRGRKETVLTALRLTGELDAGPVYLKEPLSLAGSAEEIYIRAGYLSAAMIRRIISERLQPSPQIGEVVTFKRRKPAESEIPEADSLHALHDFIRMLDAEGYPRAFITYKGFRYEFSRAALYDGRIVADVRVTPLNAGRS
jgi:methionyl-tRNA formyltransferase